MKTGDFEDEFLDYYDDLEGLINQLKRINSPVCCAVFVKIRVAS